MKATREDLREVCVLKSYGDLYIKNCLREEERQSGNLYTSEVFQEKLEERTKPFGFYKGHFHGWYPYGSGVVALVETSCGTMERVEVQDVQFTRGLV